jgi:predicted TIM-barrel fold metal-dependent hydrolase
VILHNDADVPFPKPDQEPYQLKQLGELFRQHPNTTIIWAHAGLGRVVRPVEDQLAIIDRAMGDPSLNHVRKGTQNHRLDDDILADGERRRGP